MNVVTVPGSSSQHNLQRNADSHSAPDHQVEKASKQHALIALALQTERITEQVTGHQEEADQVLLPLLGALVPHVLIPNSA